MAVGDLRHWLDTAGFKRHLVLCNVPPTLWHGGRCKIHASGPALKL